MLITQGGEPATFQIISVKSRHEDLAKVLLECWPSMCWIEGCPLLLIDSELHCCIEPGVESKRVNLLLVVIDTMDSQDTAYHHINTWSQFVPVVVLTCSSCPAFYSVAKELGAADILVWDKRIWPKNIRSILLRCLECSSLSFTKKEMLLSKLCCIESQGNMMDPRVLTEQFAL